MNKNISTGIAKLIIAIFVVIFLVFPKDEKTLRSDVGSTQDDPTAVDSTNITEDGISRTKIEPDTTAPTGTTTSADIATATTEPDTATSTDITTTTLEPDTITSTDTTTTTTTATIEPDTETLMDIIVNTIESDTTTSADTTIITTEPDTATSTDTIPAPEAAEVTDLISIQNEGMLVTPDVTINENLNMGSDVPKGFTHLKIFILTLDTLESTVNTWFAAQKNIVVDQVSLQDYGGGGYLFVVSYHKESLGNPLMRLKIIGSENSEEDAQTFLSSLGPSQVVRGIAATTGSYSGKLETITVPLILIIYEEQAL